MFSGSVGGEWPSKEDDVSQTPPVPVGWSKTDCQSCHPPDALPENTKLRPDEDDSLAVQWVIGIVIGYPRTLMT